ncbi:MAG: S8 family serine peptidase [Phycisphaeraceae bacterium]|nr:S8 family serine peptidase [Phycisphaeraceae bacterium]
MQLSRGRKSDRFMVRGASINRTTAGVWFGLEPLESRTLLSSTLPGSEELAGAVSVADVTPSPATGIAAANWIVSLGSAADVDLVTGLDFSSLGLSAAPQFESLGGSGLYRLSTNEQISQSALTSLFEGVPSFRYLEADHKLFVDVVPDDTSFSVLYALNNTGQSNGTLDADIDAPEAWDITTGSNTIVIAVLDTGIDLTHPDLAANIWTNPGEIPGDGIDNDANGYIDDVNGWDFKNNDNNPTDDQHHGTHVSGTLAGIGNNNNGVTGIAWNVKIMPLKFLGSDGLGVASDAVKALNYVAMMKQRGVNILVTNNSWGGDENTQALYDAIATQRDLGILFVAAAGNLNQNSDLTPYYPASYDLTNIISVASTDRNDSKSSFSNWGPVGTDLAAPGTSIYSTSPVSSYRTLSGTSMAVPLVSGVAALAYAAKPTATWQEVKSAILDSVDPIPQYAGLTVTGGRLNARATLETILGLPNLEPILATLAGSVSTLNAGDPLSLTATGAQDPDGVVSKVEFYHDTNSNGLFDAGSDELLGSDSSGSDGWTINVNTAGLPDGSNTFFARSVDEHNLAGVPLTTTVNVNATGVTPGYIQDAGPDGLVVIEAEEFDANSSASGSSWSAISDPSYAGGVAMQATPNTGFGVYSNVAATSPRLSFNVYFNRTGTHYLWIRGAGASLQDDSVHAGLDGVVQPALDNLNGFKSLGWYHKSNSTVAVVNVATVGLHTIDLYMREDGFVADRILLTSNSAYTPTGSGPASSPRTTTGGGNQPPSVGDLSVSPDPATVGTTLTLTATGVTDPDGTVTRVDFYRDDGDGVLNTSSDVLVGSDTNGADGWSATASTSGLSSGSYLYFARAEDNGSASGSVSTSHTLEQESGGPPAYQESGGQVTIETEIFDGVVSRSGATWAMVSSGSYSGGFAMQATPNTGFGVYSNIAATSPQLDYRVNFTTTGVYYIWVRGRGATQSDDSVHLGLDGVVASTSDNIAGFNNSLGWSRSTMDKAVATIQVTTPGLHTVNLYMREDGFIMDKLVLTTDSGFTPTGSGPASSPRTTTGGSEASEVMTVSDRFWAALAALRERKKKAVWWD